MDSRGALLERMALCQSSDTVAGVYFQYALEYVEAHGSHEALAEARLAAGRSVRVEASAILPATRLLYLLDVVGRVAEAQLRPFALGLVEVGEATGRGLFPVGQGRETARSDSPFAALEQLPALTRATCSFGVRTFVHLAPSVARLRVLGDLLGPAWNAGLVRGATTGGTGLENLRVSVDVHGPSGCDMDIWLRWRELH